ncbi:PTS transporter subunit IIABC [Mycoplasma bradburyae]|uniref:Glucose PTS transporter subunit IIA n=1 Tax=Mycoplasma bradburyae TaxID=2963128 RepID=A0AAW6HRB3_9MOLU|nr:glucose PTS transporter subunit IIA [Mycoplasma bradburyae]MDC4183635.1 glucose PTS transporter subunit IIA [Mycoplasma bradburyae]
MASTTNQINVQQNHPSGWKRFSGKFKEVVGKLSSGLMIPIAVLPIAGLLLGIFAAVQNNIDPTNYKVLYSIASFFKNGADKIFGNLPALFAVAIAVAFTNQSGIAAFAALVGWIVFNATQNALIFPDAVKDDTFTILFWENVPKSALSENVGIKSLSTSVFGGIIVGSITVYLFNKFHTIQLPKFIGFFNGNRFVPIITFLAMLPTALIMLMIWPGVSIALNYIGENLGNLARNGNTNSLFFGYIERALVPFGLHHAFYTPLWYSSAGGSIVNIISDNEHAIAPLILTTDADGSQVIRKIVGVATQAVDKPVGFTPQDWANWKQVVLALNNNKLPSTEELQGDQKIWFAINSIFVGKSVYLSGQSAPYTFTFKSFADSTLNHPSLIASAVIDGKIVIGSELLKQIASSSTGSVKLGANDSVFYAFPGVNPGQYSQGKFAFMIFGLPAAGAAMIMAAPKDQRKYASSIVISASFTSFLTGITEPIEFTFLFLAPYLFWGFHAIACAISFWLTTLIGANISQTFSGGIIDLTIYGFIPDALGAQTGSWIPLVLGLFYIPLYYFVFYFIITKRDLKTPGRGATKLYTKADYKAKTSQSESTQSSVTNFKPIEITSYKLINAFGGVENITAVNACATKLRVSVKAKSNVNFDEVNSLGSLGTYAISDTLVHAVYGGDADVIKSNMQKMLDKNYDATEIKKVAGVLEDKPTEQPKAETKPANEEIKQPTPIVDDKTKEIDPSMPKATPEADIKESDIIEVYSPVKGIVKDLTEVPDPSFAAKITGDGLAVEPTDEMFYSPVDGKLELAFNTGHAYFFDAKGAKILIHVGIDTVSLNSNNTDTENLIGFTLFSKSGDNVLYKNTPVVKANLEIIKKQELSTVTPILALKATLEEYDLKLVAKSGDQVNVGDVLFKLIKKNK